MSSITIDVDLDEILWSCGKYDRLKLIEYLIKDGDLPDELVVKDGKYVLPNKLDESTNEFNNALIRLQNRQWQLTKDEEETIKKISSKFV